MDEEELFLRTRRKEFYLRNRFTMLPSISISGNRDGDAVERNAVLLKEYLDIYTTAFGEEVSDRIHFLREVPAAEEI